MIKCHIILVTMSHVHDKMSHLHDKMSHLHDKMSHYNGNNVICT